MGFPRDGLSPGSPDDRHPTVTVIVTEKTACVSGLLSRVTLVTMMTVFAATF
jgi:hypothetical protein